MKLRIFPRKRSRFDQCRRKLGILRKKRGRKATGDSLLLSVIESLRHQNWKAAMEGLRKYLVLVQALTSEDRAIVDGICSDLETFKDKTGPGGWVMKAVFWSIVVVVEELIRHAVNLLIFQARKERSPEPRYT